MTTVPLSVCNGAINLLVRVDASYFVPYACDRAVAGEYEGPESTAPLSAISGGSLAAEQSYHTLGTLAPVFPFLGSPSTAALRVPIPSFLCPLYRPKFHLSFPKRRSQRGVVVSRT